MTFNKIKFSKNIYIFDNINLTFNIIFCAGIMTNNLEQALLFVRKVKAGSVWVNNYMAGGVQLPFGGYKLSGHGREGGPEGLLPFCEQKSVVIDLPGAN